jgi:hypothetical protein
VLSSQFAFLESQSLAFTFNVDVSDEISIADLTLMNVTTNQPVDTGTFTLTYDNLTNSITFQVNGVLQDGDYEGRLTAAGIADPTGNLLDGDGDGVGGDDFSLDFFFLQGDANRDRRVNLEDFNILAANFGSTGTNFSQADFSYDTITNLDDFNILAGRFGASLSSPATTGRFGSIRGPQQDFAAARRDEFQDKSFLA